MSLSGSVPMISARDSVPSAKRTVMRVVPFTMCRLVRMSPCSSTMTPAPLDEQGEDRKSTRLNSSHRTISYAVFCLKKKKKNKNDIIATHNKQLNDDICNIDM